MDEAFPSEMVRREASDETAERLVREHVVRSSDDGPAPAALSPMVRTVATPAFRAPLPASDDARLEPGQPQPLLGEIVSATPVTTVKGAIHPVISAERVTRSADTTEVHVHIGRIEVTALQSPPSASSKRRERAAPQTMPLSQYLAKRRPV
jgi:hypothetical protein